ncbi:MAG: hypothetical protein ABFS45_18590 [Pseudomonadota bacterium]
MSGKTTQLVSSALFVFKARQQAHSQGCVTVVATPKTDNEASQRVKSFR